MGDVEGDAQMLEPYDATWKITAWYKTPAFIGYSCLYIMPL